MGKNANYTKLAREQQAHAFDQDERVKIDSTTMYRSRETVRTSSFGGTFEELFKKASEKKHKSR